MKHVAARSLRRSLWARSLAACSTELHHSRGHDPSFSKLALFPQLLGLRMVQNELLTAKLAGALENQSVDSFSVLFRVAAAWSR
jgi:hypothetical protein